MIFTAIYVVLVGGLAARGLLVPVTALLLIPLGYLVFGYANVIRPMPAGPAALGALMAVALATAAFRPVGLGRTHLGLLLIGTAFFAWITLLHIALNQSDVVLGSLYARAGVGLIAFLLIGLLVESADDAYRFAVGVVAVIAVSSAFAVGQFLVGGPFWTVRMALGPIVEGGEAGARATGLAWETVQYSYQVAGMAPLALALALRARHRSSASFPLLLLATVVIIAGALASGTRSAILGILVAMPFVLGRRAGIALMIAGGVAMAVVAISGVLSGRFLRLDASALMRIPAMLYALQLFAENPIGLGHAGYGDALQETLHVSLNLIRTQRSINIASHNNLLNVAVAYGVIGLGLVVWFYAHFYTRLRKTIREQRSSDNYLSRGVLGAGVALLINSMLHNNGPFYGGEMTSWIVLGLGAAAIDTMRQPARGLRHPSGESAGVAAP